MLSIVIIPLLTLLAAVATLITAKDILFASNQDKNEPRKIFKGAEKSRKLSMNGYILIATMFATVALSVWQQIDNENNLEKAAARSQAQLDRLDSLNHQRVEESKNETIEALAKYGFRYDSATNQVISFLKDSAEGRDKATIGICSDGKGIEIYGNSVVLNMNLKICNFGQTLAHTFEMGLGAVIINHGKVKIEKVFKIPSGARISPQFPFSLQMDLPFGQSEKDTTYLFLHGNYKSGEKNLMLPVTEVYRFDPAAITFIMTEDRKVSDLVKNVKFQ